MRQSHIFLFIFLSGMCGHMFASGQGVPGANVSGHGVVLNLASGQGVPGANVSGDLASGHVVSGRVVDAGSNEPLAFVHLLINDTRMGGLTDIDGFFHLTHHEPIRMLQLSYVGFETKQYFPDPEKGHHVIALRRKPVELREVTVLPEENPAHRIIELAIQNRDLHHPERMGSFSYHSYNKFIFTGEVDPPSDSPDLIGTVTVANRLSQYLEQRHFFLMETVTERKFRYPDRSNETVIASRILGMQHPLFAIFMSQMQSFSFYDDYIEIFGDRYLSPLMPGSTRRYFFLLEDTTYTATDTVFVISYRPSRGRNFEGLKGILYIHSDQWALQSVIAEPASAGGDSRIRIQQNYERFEGRWFPVQLNTDFELVNISDLRGLKILGTGRSYLQDIHIKPPLARRDFSSFHVEFSPETIVEDDAFWDDYRRDSLSVRELNTYHYLDSVGRELDLDKRIERIETLFGGYWRRGFLDVDLGSLLRYNRHEGFRLGVGFQTNQSFSRRFRVRAMTGYGFGDNTWKYGAGASVLLDRLSDLRLGYDYQNDVIERGGSGFISSPNLLSAVNIRNFFLETMDMGEMHTLWLQSRIFRNYLTLKLFASLEEVSYPDDYRYGSDPGLPEGAPGQEWPGGQARFFELGAWFRFAYGERFILTPRQIMPLQGNFPVLHLNIARGMDAIMDGEYGYWRLEMKVNRQFEIPMLGRQHWTIRAGYFSGEAPWNKRFTAPGVYRRFSVSTPGTFSTMRVDEFVSDRYVALFWHHHFENLLYRGRSFNPQLVLLTNIGFGHMHDRERHLNTTFNTMERGFFESGIAILNLIGSDFTSLGLEFSVRYGPYAYPCFKDNFSLLLGYSVMF